MWTATPLIILLAWGVVPGSAKLFRSQYDLRRSRFNRNPVPVEGEVGTKLILTPYIEAGNIEEARSLSSVTGGYVPADISSHSGFFTVNKTYNSNLFFWFFPAEVSNSVHVNLHGAELRRLF
jgi:vitellogenic carboxypeptidase-like protein